MASFSPSKQTARMNKEQSGTMRKKDCNNLALAEPRKSFTTLHVTQPFPL